MLLFISNILYRVVLRTLLFFRLTDCALLTSYMLRVTSICLARTLAG